MKIISHLKNKYDRRLLSPPLRGDLGGILFLLCSLLCFSCTEDIVLPIEDGERMLVVEASLTTEAKAHQVKLSLSSNFYSEESTSLVSGATVTITENENVHILTEVSSGVYETASDFSAVPQVTYRLNISNIDINKDGELEEYWSESSCVEINPIEMLAVVEMELFGRKTLSTIIYMKDNGDVDNYYMGKLYINDVLVTDTITDCFFMDDMYFNGSYIDGRFPIFNLKSETDERQDKWVVRPGDKVTAQAYGIPKDFYYFIGDIRSAGSSNPFMGSPANPRSNILPKGRAAGFFYVASTKIASTIYGGN
jgi:hypothetical protein